MIAVLSGDEYEAYAPATGTVLQKLVNDVDSVRKGQVFANKQADQLSGGQQQRVAVARVNSLAVPKRL